jgi:hypothetical protein
MRKVFVAWICVLGMAASASAQSQGSLTVFFSPSSSDLQAPALTGAPSYKNDGHYGGAFGDTLLAGRVGVMGGMLFGSSNTIPGGANFGTPSFNPTTHEVARILDVAATFALVKTKAARLDATAGYFYLHAKPEISPANSYGGPSLGFRAKYVFPSNFDVHGNLSLIPTYFVKGNVAGELGEDNIIQYRFGADYGITKNFGVSGGFQGFKLSAKVVGIPNLPASLSVAVVTLRGFYFGGQAKW